MAKKKTIDLREPTPVPAGDVNIIYNGTRIGGFSEDTDATLKTGGTRVLSDINVNYTKPSGSAIGNTVNLSTDIVGEQVSIQGPFFDATGVDYPNLTAENDNPGTSLVLCSGVGGGYAVAFYFESEDDLYSMTVNGTPVTFERGAYSFFSSTSANPINGQTYNVVITNKQV